MATYTNETLGSISLSIVQKECMCLSILVCIHDMKSWEVFKSKQIMDVCKRKPNENFFKKKRRRNFYLKTKGFRLQKFS